MPVETLMYYNTFLVCEKAVWCKLLGVSSLYNHVGHDSEFMSSSVLFLRLDWPACKH